MNTNSGIKLAENDTCVGFEGLNLAIYLDTEIEANKLYEFTFVIENPFTNFYIFASKK